MKYSVVVLLLLFSVSCSQERPDPVDGNRHTAGEAVTTTREMVGQTDPEKRLQELGIELRDLSGPSTASFVTAVRMDNALYLSGRGPVQENGEFVKGKLGRDLTIEQGYEAARLTGIDLLAAIKHELGDLNRVKQLVKVLGVVNADPDFESHPQVINGFSDLMLDVFGERGQHARSALGMGSLPFGIPVEIEMIVEIQD